MLREDVVDRPGAVACRVALSAADLTGEPTGRELTGHTGSAAVSLDRDTVAAKCPHRTAAARSWCGTPAPVPSPPGPACPGRRRVQVEVGVKLTARAGAVIAKTGAEGHLETKLTWTRDLGPEREGEVDRRCGRAVVKR